MYLEPTGDPTKAVNQTFCELFDGSATYLGCNRQPSDEKVPQRVEVRVAAVVVSSAGDDLRDLAAEPVDLV